MKRTAALLVAFFCLTAVGCGDSGERVMRDLTTAFDSFASDMEKANDKQSAQQAADDFLAQLDQLIERKKAIGELTASTATKEACDEAGKRAITAKDKAVVLTQNQDIERQIVAKLATLYGQELPAAPKPPDQ